MFTPHIDTGDNVIVINAEKVKLTVRNADADLFYWHTVTPGGIKHRSKVKLDGAHPTRAEKAVQRIKPKESPLLRAQFKNCMFMPVRNTHTRRKSLKCWISLKQEQAQRVVKIRI